MARRTTHDVPGSRADRFRAVVRTTAERLALGFASGVATSLVLLWGGMAWSSARLAGFAAGALVVVAAWVASTVPAPPAPPRRDLDAPASDREQGRS